MSSIDREHTAIVTRMWSVLTRYQQKTIHNAHVSNFMVAAHWKFEILYLNKACYTMLLRANVKYL